MIGPRLTLKTLAILGLALSSAHCIDSTTPDVDMWTELPGALDAVSDAGLDATGDMGPDAAPDATRTDIGQPNTTWTEASHSNDADPDYTIVFDPSSVIELKITITAANFQAMDDDMAENNGAFGAGGGGPGGGGPGGGGPGGGGPGGGGGIDLVGTDPIYAPVTISYDGKEWTDVGMRYKGNSTLSGSWSSGIRKLPFRLKFDAYEDSVPSTNNQRFYGFKKLTFASAYNDSSFIRDAMMNEILVDNGIPAARYRFVRIVIDHGDGPTYFGLYVMLEDPSDAMMERVYGDKGGNIYKPEGTGADWTEFLETGFEKKTNEDDADWSDVQAAVAALNADRTDAAAWRAGLEAVFDMDHYLLWLAVNTFVGNWDTYGGLAHNYYLFGHPDTGVMQWIPWDHNEAMQSKGGPFGAMAMDLSSAGATWPLIRFVADDPVYGPIYWENLDSVALSLAAEGNFGDRITELHDLVAPHVVGENGETAPYTTLTNTNAFTGSVSELTSYMAGRHATLVSF